MKCHLLSATTYTTSVACAGWLGWGCKGNCQPGNWWKISWVLSSLVCYSSEAVPLRLDAEILVKIWCIVPWIQMVKLISWLQMYFIIGWWNIFGARTSTAPFMTRVVQSKYKSQIAHFFFCVAGRSGWFWGGYAEIWSCPGRVVEGTKRYVMCMLGHQCLGHHYLGHHNTESIVFVSSTPLNGTQITS